MEIGIDKIRLTTRDFKVKDARGLNLKGSMSVIGQDAEQTYLFTDGTGRRVHGAGVFCNDDLFNIDISEMGIKAECNPSKPYHPYNLCADTDTLYNRLKTVTDRIRDIYGITADWEQAKVSRLDVSRNIETRDPVGYYRDVYGIIGMPRSKRQAQYPDGYSTGNNSTGLIMYNKLQEIRDGGGDLKGDNLLRAELQFKKTQSVKSHLKLVTVNDLITCGVEHCQDIYRGYMQKNVFREKAGQEQKIIPFNDAHYLLTELKKKHPRDYIQMFKKPFGLMELSEMCGGLENWLKLIAEVSGNRKTPAKEKKAIAEQMKIRARLLRKCPTSKRYKELLTKLVA